MRYLIDGHNLIAQLPEISFADPDDEAKLVQRLARWRWRHHNVPLTVVFDPGDFPVHGQSKIKCLGIEVRYASYDSDADTTLKRMITCTRDPRQLTIVSSDREIRTVAARRGARVITAQTFAQELTQSPPPEEESMADQPLSPEEVEAWLRLFQAPDGLNSIRDT